MKKLIQQMICHDLNFKSLKTFKIMQHILEFKMKRGSNHANYLIEHNTESIFASRLLIQIDKDHRAVNQIMLMHQIFSARFMNKLW